MHTSIDISDAHTFFLLPGMPKARLKLIEVLLDYGVWERPLPADPETGKVSVAELAEQAGISAEEAFEHLKLINRWAAQLGTTAGLH
jgi:hypothetical protein